MLRGAIVKLVPNAVKSRGIATISGPPAVRVSFAVSALEL